MGNAYIFIEDDHGYVLYIHESWPWVSLIYSLKMVMGKSHIFIKMAMGKSYILIKHRHG